MKQSKFSILFVLLTVLLSTNSVFAQKMTAAEVLSKHLDSIGTKEKRASIKNQTIFSDVQMSLKVGTLKTSGKGVFFSEGERNSLGFALNSNEYPADQFSFNAKNVKTSYITPGNRSVLGGFIYSYPELLKQGLLGGTLLSSWTLLNTETNKAKLSYDGTSKINGKETYVISYQPKGGSDLDIKMYFDAKTFQHMRTDYHRYIGARMGRSVDGSAGQSSNRYRLTEDFSNFQKLDGLVLPGEYTITYSSTGVSSTQAVQNANREIEWKFKVTNYSYNQKLNDTDFEIAGK